MDIRYKKRIKKDIKRRHKLLKNGYQNVILKSIVRNEKLPVTIRQYAKKVLTKKYYKFSVTNVNHFCVLSSNFRGVFKKFGLSRGYLKEYARLGQVVGLYKK